MPSPRVSIITSTFNAGGALPATIDAIRAQTFRDFEWIVIDGGSTDATLPTLRTHADAVGYLVSERDAGIYDAWNKGLDVARGDWIAFLGAGDTYGRDALARYMDLIDAHPDREELQYVSSRVALVAGGRRIRVIGSPWRWSDFRNYMCVAHVGSLHHRTLFSDGRRFDTTYRITGDYELLLRFGPSLRTAFLDHVTATMLAGGASDSFQRAFLEQERAKVTTGARSAGIARAQRLTALVKATVRRALWY